MAKRKRTSRMHAAIDAMLPFGFSSGTVQATVRTLLKEYGGDDYWPFIESDAYSLLICALLKEQEEEYVMEESSIGQNFHEASREGAIQTSECGGTDAATPELHRSPICARNLDSSSHATQPGGSRKESSLAKVLKKRKISSRPSKMPTFSLAKPLLEAKSGSLNGWLFDDDDEDDDNDNGNNLAKLNPASNLAR